jgi:hypothetical protein
MRYLKSIGVGLLFAFLGAFAWIVVTVIVLTEERSGPPSIDVTHMSDHRVDQAVGTNVAAVPFLLEYSRLCVSLFTTFPHSNFPSSEVHTPVIIAML